MFYVYMYVDPRTETVFYVGKGTGNRAYDLRTSRRSKTVTARIRMLQECGLKHITELAYVPSEEDAFWFERDLIASLGRKDRGKGHLLNHTDGGEGLSGYITNDATRKKISEAKKGQPFSSEHKKSLSLANKGKISNRKGMLVSDESKLKMSLAKKGRKLTQEHKDKIKAHRVECPHCHKISIKGPMIRYHFDNCKHKEVIS